jgi:hypothetical protein
MEEHFLCNYSCIPVLLSLARCIYSVDSRLPNHGVLFRFLNAELQLSCLTYERYIFKHEGCGHAVDAMVLRGRHRDSALAAVECTCVYDHRRDENKSSEVSACLKSSSKFMSSPTFGNLKSCSNT